MRRRLELGLGALGVERVDDGVVQVLDSTDLFLADTRLRLDDVPKLENAGVNFVDIYWGVDRVGTGHPLDVRLELSDAFADDLGHNEITILADLDVRCSWERYCVIRQRREHGFWFGSTYHLYREKRCSRPRGSSL